MGGGPCFVPIDPHKMQIGSLLGNEREITIIGGFDGIFLLYFFMRISLSLSAHAVVRLCACMCIFFIRNVGLFIFVGMYVFSCLLFNFVEEHSPILVFKFFLVLFLRYLNSLG